MSAKPTLRVRVWVNHATVFDGKMDNDEFARVPRMLKDKHPSHPERMLNPDDSYVVIFHGLNGLEPPGVACRDDQVFAQDRMRELFPGRKIPEGEMSQQIRYGPRFHEAPPDVWDGIR